ncbi:hypothetical protein SLEP1_g15603 [Rubroshorea leprosula]|uniref:Phospholipase D n=1 Tax=Rubroshorea leprosula TaxID=152421 RepID=A0AAV5ITV4_9ROSI|nr:hypothetical protein SLEP1_g15603 [Rubroshorea leprosula]
MNSGGADQQQVLHGTLYVTIFKADPLQRKPESSEQRPPLKSAPSDTVSGSAVRAVYEVKEDFDLLIKGKSEVSGEEDSLYQEGLYATIDLGNATVARTKCVADSTDLTWNEIFRINCAHSVSRIAFTIKENNIWDELKISSALDKVKVKTIGKAYLPVAELMTNLQAMEKQIKIEDEGRNQIEEKSYLHVKILFVSALQESQWFPKIGSPKFTAVPYSFYPARERCRVTLYQDAHVLSDFNLQLVPSFGEEQNFETNRCWEDMYESISKAKQLIYIAGWSFNHKVRLVREGVNPNEIPTIGELLKKKAKEGVGVRMLIWKNLFADIICKTNANETENFFKGTAVKCHLSSRSVADKPMITNSSKIPYSHHQKFVVVDSEVPDGETKKRTIVSYIGGLDLDTGRYDTPKHSLFRTLHTVHKDDFHQTCLKGASWEKGGPRLPWHDIHCKIEGPAAWDVMDTFEQRWTFEVRDINWSLPKNPDLIRDTSTVMSSPTHPDLESWNVQVFRSMDDCVASGYPKDLSEMVSRGLVSKKGVIIEQGIQDAYVNAIRRAKNFIYIENLFFLGSSFAWKEPLPKAKTAVKAEVKSLHIIPKEISLKIVSKIKANERFSVYVLIPMWPGDSADSFVSQRTLEWQWRTMEMMYDDIAGAIRETRMQADPRDYLSFFCLGNREVELDSDFRPKSKPDFGSHHSTAQRNRRFMIYVHSKMMIVDDEYIIVGSANINQRSMHGARDTEIAMGAYQPYHIADGEGEARGKVHDCRMSLWYEHIGELKESFKYPQSLGCMQQVNEIADRNWDLFADKKFDQDLPSHLLRYPIKFQKNGEFVRPTETEAPVFPDTQVRIMPVNSDLWSSIPLLSYLTT